MRQFQMYRTNETKYIQLLRITDVVALQFFNLSIENLETFFEDVNEYADVFDDAEANDYRCKEMMMMMAPT